MKRLMKRLEELVENFSASDEYFPHSDYELGFVDGKQYVVDELEEVLEEFREDLNPKKCKKKIMNDKLDINDFKIDKLNIWVFDTEEMNYDMAVDGSDLNPCPGQVHTLTCSDKDELTDT